jgi:hypothetical protein
VLEIICIRGGVITQLEAAEMEQIMAEAKCDCAKSGIAVRFQITVVSYCDFLSEYDPASTEGHAWLLEPEPAESSAADDAAAPRESLLAQLALRDEAMIFTGATGAMRGKPPYIAFAQGKAGVRMLAQAREFGPEGLHVSHVIIDGGVGGSRLGDIMGVDVEGAVSEGSMLAPDSCAETFYQLHLQDPSAWTQEMELRPMNETW